VGAALPLRRLRFAPMALTGEGRPMKRMILVATTIAALSGALPTMANDRESTEASREPVQIAGAAADDCVIRVGPFTQIAVSGDGARPLSCGVVTSGRAHCWGNDQFEQLSVPEGDFVEVGAGPYHACGRRPNGTIECWGNDDNLEDTDAPAGSFSQLAIGHWGPNCALRTNGTTACWGYGELVLDVPGGVFERISAGAQRACAFDGEGDATCWRYVEGDSPADIVMEPVDIPTGPFAEISMYFDAGPAQQDSHFCGRRPNGQVACWTDEVGLEAWEAPSGTFVKLSAGGGFACGIRTGGNIECWGPDWLEETLFPPEGEFIAAAAGAGHLCGLTESGTVVCAGYAEPDKLCPVSDGCGNGNVENFESCDDGDTSFAAGDACTDGCWNVPCGQPLHPEAEGPVASDALFALRAAVGSASCSTEVCDVDSSSTVTSVDALAILRKSVDPGRSLACSS
jgi:hypothetical protein